MYLTLRLQRSVIGVNIETSIIFRISHNADRLSHADYICAVSIAIVVIRVIVVYVQRHIVTAKRSIMTTREYFKVVLLGETGTGKTCMMKRYFNNVFNPTEPAVSYFVFFFSRKCCSSSFDIDLNDDVCFFFQTIGAAFASKIFNVYGKEYQMGVWDTTGQER